MLMDPSITAKAASTELLLEQARSEEDGLRQEWSAARERVAQLERELRRLRDLASGKQDVSLESVRDVVIQFRGGFTDSELASQLGVPITKVKKHIKALVESGAVSDTGERFNRRAIYEYIKPEEPGSSFEAQQRLQPEAPPSPMGDVPVTIVHAPRGVHKDVRRVVKDAMQRGWKVDQTGEGHYQLTHPVFTKGKPPVRFASTPKNPSIEAMHLKRNLGRAERVG